MDARIALIVALMVAGGGARAVLAQATTQPAAVTVPQAKVAGVPATQPAAMVGVMTQPAATQPVAGAGVVPQAAAGAVTVARQPIVEALVPAGVPVDVLRTQLVLDRTGFSPGLIDGKPGRKTKEALERLNVGRPGAPVVGVTIDEGVAAEYLKGQPLLRVWTVTAEDLKDIGPWPDDWVERSKLDRMRYESAEALFSERGHCTVAFLKRLNPGVDFANLQPGTGVVLPNVLEQFPRAPKAGVLVIDLDEKTIDAFTDEGAPIALFHCSIAKDVAKRPAGQAVVVNVAFDPNYLWDPVMWPEVVGINKKLFIPPGPRNPVGMAWVGLSLPGYGIHGTPWPENIGKTGSHGCFRLTNWDAVRLARIIRVGSQVRFTHSGGNAAFDPSVGR
jgi:lipoprotein-anchoring transpeptidase ErfK/SrfK